MRWLIDGHNLIGQMPGLRLDDPNDEEKLVEYLHRYCARTGHRVVVFFDAGESYHPPETKKQGRVTVQFAARGQTADQLIKQRLGGIKNSQEVIVVTSDRAVQQAARQAHVRTLTAPEFIRQLLPALSAGPEQADPGNRAEVRLSADEVDEWLKLFKNKKVDEHAQKRNVPPRKSSRTPGSDRRDSGRTTPGRPGKGTGSSQK